MNIRPSTPMSKAAFIEWGATAEERYELVRGRVVMMARPALAHALIITNLIVALRGRLDPNRWVVISEFGIDAGPETLRYPDVVVDPVGGAAKDYTAKAPVLLAEVLSPSSVETDLGDKPAEYLQIPTVLAYIVVSQDEPKAWVYARSGGEFTPGPAVITGTEAFIEIPALQLELPMADIYAGIQTD